MSTTKTLIIGSSGTIGSQLSQLLRARGVSVRETTSRKENASAHPTERAFLNLATGEGLHAAFEGVDRAFFLSPPGFADQYKILSPLIQEAKRRGLKKVVLMTAMGANAVETSPFRRAEIELERSGLTYNIIRPNWFLQNFNTFWVQGIKDHGSIALPAGHAKVSFIDARDVAAVACELLTSVQWANRDFDLTGKASVDHTEIAQAVGKAVGRRVSYQDIPPQVLQDGLIAAGLPADYVAFMIMIFGFLREGYNAKTTDSVQLITGKDARTVAQYVQDYLAAWK